jgi:hypothetical protein
MKKEYDFSKGIRGKFYHKDLKLNIPIYLEPDTMQFIAEIAAKKKKDASTVVNELLKSDMEILDYVK